MRTGLTLRPASRLTNRARCLRLLIVVGIISVLLQVRAVDAQEARQAADGVARGVQKVAVIMVYYQDELRPTLPKSHLEEVITTLGRYYEENSYGQITFADSAVYGWYELPLQNADCHHVWQDVQAAAIKVADADIDYTHYNWVLIADSHCLGAFRGGGPSTIATDEGEVTMQLIGSQDYYSFIFSTIAHEFGHGLGPNGLGHANFLDCGQVSLVAAPLDPYDPHPCQSWDYAERFNIMGSGLGGGGHFNAAQKTMVGWLQEGAGVQTVTANGTFTLEPLETATGGLKALRIPRGRLATLQIPFMAQPDQTDYLYVEYRQPIGFDEGHDPQIYEGALLHILQAGPATATWLLDASPPSISFVTTPALSVGQSFTDPASGATLTVLEKSRHGLTVQVSGLGDRDGNTVPPTVNVASPTPTAVPPVTPATPTSDAPSSPPTRMTLTATRVFPDQVRLHWTTIPGAADYQVVRNDTLIAHAIPPYTDYSVATSTPYTYQVVAYDASGNRRAVSNTVMVPAP